MSPHVAGLMKRGVIWGVVAVALGIFLYRIMLMPVAVHGHAVEIDGVVAQVMGTGTLEARYQSTVSAKIQGRIVELTADQNDRVKKQQLLARLDDVELLQEVSIARATLEAGQATVERLQAEEARVKAVLEQAQRDYERYSSLLATKSISQEAVEKSRERLAVAEAEVAKAAAASREGVRQVVTAEERLRFQEARLADTRVLSPFDGLVVRRDRELGDVVVPGASIFQMVSTEEMWVSAWVDESAAADLAAGQPARIVFRSEPHKPYQGKVVRLGREMDRETREFRIDVLVDTLPANWAVGQRAEVYVETGRRSGVVCVPLRAMVWRDAKAGVQVVHEGRVQWREVVWGLRDADKIEVKQGLSKGEVVIVGPQSARLNDGQRVAVK